MGLGDAVSDLSETDKRMIRLQLSICIDARVLYFRVSKYASGFDSRYVNIFRNSHWLAE